jgi:hypothetical protein
MKLFLAMTATLLLMVGCAGNKEQPAGANAPTSTNQAEAGKAAKPSATEATAKTDATTSARPIEFTCLGISADKQSVNFNIKVNADKRITQVDVALKEMDDSGKVLLQTDYAWQNIVNSVRQPIEKGKTYLGEGYLYPGATRVECSLKRVIFEDRTRWSPS